MAMTNIITKYHYLSLADKSLLFSISISYVRFYFLFEPVYSISRAELINNY